MNWTLSWNGQTWSFADILTGHVTLLRFVYGDDVHDNLDPRISPCHLVALLAVLLSDGTSENAFAVLLELNTVPFYKLVNALSEV